MKSLSVIIYLKSSELFFPVVQFNMLYKMALTNY